jgi:L-asparaginase II
VEAGEEDPPGAQAMIDAYVPVAVTERSGFTESVHHGAVVALAGDGSLEWAAGDPDVVIYPRSSLKPLQAASMVGAGLDLEDRLLAVVCASHDGRPEHLAAVAEILASAGLDPADLRNTPTLPLDPDASVAAVQTGESPSSIMQNCSGKHAGMLATAVINGWPTNRYTAPDHPVQRRILEDLQRDVGPVEHVGVDGCGAPAATVSLRALAKAVRRLATDGHPVQRAMTRYPEMVGGPKRNVTVLMRALPGLLVKDGAEGVFVAAVPDGRAVAVKIGDGGGRAAAPVLVATLRALEIDVAGDAVVELILGHGEPVGRVHSLVGSP